MLSLYHFHRPPNECFQTFCKRKISSPFTNTEMKLKLLIGIRRNLILRWAQICNRRYGLVSNIVEEKALLLLITETQKKPSEVSVNEWILHTLVVLGDRKTFFVQSSIKARHVLDQAIFSQMTRDTCNISWYWNWSSLDKANAYST